MLLTTLAEAAVPVCFCVMVGWVAARLSILDAKQIRPISIFVVTFGLPAALFIGTFKFSVGELAQWQNLVVLLISMTAVWVMAFLVGRLVFRTPASEASILALNCSFPDMAYLGIPLMTALFSTTGLLPVVLGNLVSSFVLIPLTVVFLHRQAARDTKGSATLAKDLEHMILQPLVWAPLLAVGMVLAGVGLPALLGKSVGLFGQASSGTALFALGVLLYSMPFKSTREVWTVLVLKNFAEPALAAVLAVSFGLHGPVAQGLLIVVACPCATASAMFSSSYGIAQEATAASVVVSTAGSLLTLSGWVVLSKVLVGS